MLPLGISVAPDRSPRSRSTPGSMSEFFLTAGQSLFAIALLLRLGLHVAGAAALAALFALQVLLAFAYRDDEAGTVVTQTCPGWAYIALAAAIAAANLNRLNLIWRGLTGDMRCRRGTGGPVNSTTARTSCCGSADSPREVQTGAPEAGPWPAGLARPAGVPDSGCY